MKDAANERCQRAELKLGHNGRTYFQRRYPVSHDPCTALILAPPTRSPKMRRLVGPPIGPLQRPLRLRAIPLGFEVRNGSATLQVRAVCNLYSITTNQAAIAALFRVMNRYVGNLAPMPGVFPDYPAPVVRNAGAERELTMMRWGMPPPPKFGGPPVTNIRNTASPHWRGWLSGRKRRRSIAVQKGGLNPTGYRRREGCAGSFPQLKAGF
jgi:hypothetical protein